MTHCRDKRYDVVIATYNGESFLPAQLESILGQSARPHAIYIRDDGSTDGTLTVIKNYVSRFPNIIHVAGGERLGYVKNFEALVRHCTSPIVFFSDQDDVWVPSKAAEILAAFQSGVSSDCVYSNATIVNEELAPINALIDPKVQSPASLADLLRSSTVTGATMACDRQFLLEVCIPFDGDVPHDYWIAFHAARRSKLRYVPTMLTLYRQHGGNQIGGRTLGVIQRAIQALTNDGFRKRRKTQYYRHRLLQELRADHPSAKVNFDGISLLDAIYGTSDGAISLSGIAHVARSFGPYSLLFVFDWMLVRRAWIAKRDK